MQPFQPPFDTEPLAGIGGQISARSEDFVVDEVQLYDWSGEGDHLMVRFRKTGMNTQFAVKAIARAAGVDARDIGVAGQKDRWAVTSQWVSIPKRSAPWRSGRCRRASRCSRRPFTTTSCGRAI